MIMLTLRLLVTNKLNSIRYDDASVTSRRKQSDASYPSPMNCNVRKILGFAGDRYPVFGPSVHMPRIRCFHHHPLMEY